MPGKKFKLDELIPDYEPTMVRRVGRSYVIKGVEDEPLSSREFLVTMLSYYRSTVEEIALMRLSFHMNPEHNEAAFGIDGSFLYTSQYYPQIV